MLKLLTTLILTIIFTALAILLAWKVIPGVEIESWKAAFVVAGILAVASWLINQLLSRTTTPSTFIFALISFVVTAFFVYVIAQRYEGFSLDNFRTAVLLTALLTLVQIMTGVKKG